MNTADNKENVFSIVFSVTSLKVAAQSIALCDAFIYTDLSSSPRACAWELGRCFFSSFSNLKVGMCGKGPMC